jgi:hypothetical protein
MISSLVAADEREEEDGWDDTSTHESSDLVNPAADGDRD